MLFHKPFQFRKVLAMSPRDIHEKTAKVDGKCYRYIAEDTQCEILSSK
jgi:hypothetical protein